MSRELKKDLKDIKGLIVKRSKSGQRYLLHDKDLRGKDIYVTVDITDKTPKHEYSEKIEQARIKLNSKKSCASFERLVDEYILVRNLASSTAYGLRLSLRGFGFNNKSNRLIVLDLFKSGLKNSTVKTKISHISSFFKWIILSRKADGLIDPTQGVRVKDAVTHRTRTLTDNEIDVLFALMKKRSKEDKLALRLAFFTGARISSICALTPNSIKDGKIYYYNVKCSRPYKYPVPIMDKETIDLFNTLAKTGKIIQSTTQMIKQRINAWLRRTFGKKEGEYITIHTLRHTFATRAIQAGIAPDIISRLLDHSSIQTTLRVYAKHSYTQLEQAIDTMFKTPS